MSFEFISKLPTPAEIRHQFPLSEELTQLKHRRDQEIRDILTGKDDRFLVIIGPCSADNEDSVCDYVSRLIRVQEDTKDRLLIVPRVYTNKPRTTGDGYKGILHQPNPEKAPDLFEGLLAIRKLHMRVLKETGLSAADEMLYPENYRYLSDLLSYVAVGARSVENQQHRLTVSGMDVGAGMKNPTSGDYSVMLNSVMAAQHGHTFIFRGWEVHTDGNPYTHTILRGPACIVDANHSNSNKQYQEQIRIVKEVLHSRNHSMDVRRLVKGVMIESYIEPGSQKIGGHIYGCSITDPCLGWEESRQLVYDIAEQV